MVVSYSLLRLPTAPLIALLTVLSAMVPLPWEDASSSTWPLSSQLFVEVPVLSSTASAWPLSAQLLAEVPVLPSLSRVPPRRPSNKLLCPRTWQTHLTDNMGRSIASFLVVVVGVKIVVVVVTLDVSRVLLRY